MGADLPNARPTQTFLLLVSDGDTPRVREAMDDFVEAIGPRRDWQCGPPIHVLKGGDGDDAEDTMGCEFAVFSALPLGSLPRELDRQAYDDVSFVVGEAASFSQRHGVTIELLEMQDGGADLIGEIQDGVPDRGIRDGLLGEWRRALDA